MSTEMLVVLIVLAAVLLLFVGPVAVLSYILYRILLVRTGPEKWGRECSLPEDEEYKRMFDIGAEWFGNNRNAKHDVSIVSDGYKLAGEYFDFGYDKAVIVIPGRMESCVYSYYFAEPYVKAGYNVLAIDNRAHGLSEGRRCSLGYKEYRDIINWSKYLHDGENVNTVVLHGLCIGASTALFALTAEDCPDYIKGMVAEGMYTTFAESFRNHMIVDNHPLFPIFYAAMLQIRLLSGANVVSDGPIKRIDRLTKPILFLHSREDCFSLPDKAQVLYEKCTAPKTMEWFEKGSHSRIRISNTEKYDAAVVKFLAGNIN